MINSGIYLIKNVCNGKTYIGSSSNIKVRISAHLSLLSRDIHSNKHLQSSYNKYGKENFLFSTLLYCNVSSLEYYEQVYIDKLKPEYNIREVAKSNRGIKLSEQTKAKIGVALKGRSLSKETIIKIRLSKVGKSNGLEGIPKTEAAKNKISTSLMGHEVSEITRKKLHDRNYKTSNYKNAKVYHGIVSPDGVVYDNIFNLSQFCLTRNLNDSLLRLVIKGKRKVHKGWTMLDTKSDVNTAIIIDDVEG